MRPSLLVSLLLLSILTQEAHGIRLRKGSLPARDPIIHEESVEITNVNKKDVNDEEDVVCKGKHCSGTKKRKLSKIVKGPHHWLPSIHEDYYGPRGHKPRHH